MAGRSGDGDLLSEINVTPLVDVMLVLLVVLMVAASYGVSRGLALQLPKAGQTQPTGKSFVIQVSEDGKWLLRSQEVTRSALQAELRALPSSSAVVIEAAGAVAYERVVRLMDAIREVGIVNIAFATAPWETQ